MCCYIEHVFGAVMVMQCMVLILLQANMAIQESRYEAAMKDLNKAQAELDEKQRELDAVQAVYEQAMREKQVCFATVSKLVSHLRVDER